MAGYINSKLRASLTPENLEYFTIAKILLTRDIKQPKGSDVDLAAFAEEALESSVGAG